MGREETGEVYDRIDEDALAALVDRFYAQARTDPQLAPVFEGAVQDWPPHLARIADFWSSVMLGSGRYKGNPFAAHVKLPIQPDMFEAWLALWGETVGELFVPPLADSCGSGRDGLRTA